MLLWQCAALQAGWVHLSSEPPHVQTVQLQILNKPMYGLEVVCWVSHNRGRCHVCCKALKHASFCRRWRKPSTFSYREVVLGAASTITLGALLGWRRRGSLSSLIGHHQQTRVVRVHLPASLLLRYPTPCPAGGTEGTASKCVLLGVHTLMLRRVLL